MVRVSVIKDMQAMIALMLATLGRLGRSDVTKMPIGGRALTVLAHVNRNGPVMLVKQQPIQGKMNTGNHSSKAKTQLALSYFISPLRLERCWLVVLLPQPFSFRSKRKRNSIEPKWDLSRIPLISTNALMSFQIEFV
jgi:hypothetical protein